MEHNSKERRQQDVLTVNDLLVYLSVRSLGFHFGINEENVNHHRSHTVCMVELYFGITVARETHQQTPQANSPSEFRNKNVSKHQPGKQIFDS